MTASPCLDVYFVNIFPFECLFNWESLRKSQKSVIKVSRTLLNLISVSVSNRSFGETSKTSRITYQCFSWIFTRTTTMCSIVSEAKDHV